MSFKSTKAKNDFGRDHRTPLACSSCFTVHLPCIARRVAVAMNHRFSETVASAQGLCQTLSVSQAEPPFDSSAAAERQEKRGPDNMITPTDGHGDRDTSAYASLGVLVHLMGAKGRSVPLMAMRWISSHTLKRPFSCSRENESWERISQSFSQGHWCLATFWAALPTVTICAETIAEPIQFGPSFFFFFLSTSVQAVRSPTIVFAPAESRAWIDDLMNLKRAQQIIAVNLVPAH